MMQSRRQSLIEAITNVVVGYALAVLTQIVVFPWFGLQIPFRDNLAIGALFVIISLLRSYALRRIFERWR
ncbi:hypothetical protein PXK17_20110 [Phaeobacter gallaeciensis]|uniref:Uncharacterized protein n=2 Tax=Phaeobacter gallaeciensis TaxID=60890 RepID=A0ABD4XFF4_9RHOB|nr:hypothetical protein [Phaeobacter gallaeciensis]MDE4146933.1 hypothetical protein [Phaeobacter gallaeciensis]MDE4159606.1 hypothetical protein [Phaeobacter gallaeciensis]MDE4163782.1 hypothetical protein [Phaeobacter gallaeciensis]MDE4168061.1 hypothetical protein [Phaeobacter gallaeciensis]MDE4172249.1 hypothetical protein [Phaeobacter gallaeciensis]